MRRYLLAGVCLLLAGPALGQAGPTGPSTATPWFKSVRGDAGAATANGVALAITQAQAAAALPTTQFSATPAISAYASSGQTLAAQFSNRLSVKDYGAKGDGSTDDTVAFEKAIAVATGRIAGNLIFTQAEQTLLAGLDGIGGNYGRNCIDVPPGVYVLSKTLVASLQANNGFCMMGAGTGMSKLRWISSGDGLDVNFAATAFGNDIVQSPGTNYPGQAVLVKGLAFQTAYNNPVNASTGLITSYNPGVALNIKGIPLINSNVAPTQVIEDVAFTNADGWIGYQQAWAVGLRFTDPDFVFINRALSIDLREGKTAGFQMVSDTPAGGTGHGEIVCQDCGSYGGSGFFDISGRGIQGVYLSRPYWLDNIQTGVTWLAAAGTASGSLSMTGASGGAGSANVHVTNIGTYLSSGGFYYTSGTTVNTDWHGEWLDGVDWVNVSGDIITAPPAGAQNAGGTAFNAYGIVVNQGAMGAGVYDGLPSVISGVSVAGSDVGFSGQGPNILFNGAECAPNTTNGRTTVCFQDSYTGADGRYHPHFENMVTDNNMVYADAGHDLVVHGSLSQYFGAGIELGMPGVTLPGVGMGVGGQIDWHSTTSTNGLVTGLNDYDCRQTVSGGTAGTSGLGLMNLYCAGGFSVNGPISGTFVTASATLQGLNVIGTGAVFGDQFLPFTSGKKAQLGATAGATVTVLEASGAIVDGSPVPVAVTSGAAITAADNTSGQILVCPDAGNILTGITDTLPLNPKPKQRFRISAECAMSLSIVSGASTVAVTTASGTIPAGSTAQVQNAPASLAVGGSTELTYDNDRHIWTGGSGSASVTPFTAPTSETSTCIPNSPLYPSGTVQRNGVSYFEACVATNTWGVTALSTNAFQ